MHVDGITKTENAYIVEIMRTKTRTIVELIFSEIFSQTKRELIDIYWKWKYPAVQWGIIFEEKILFPAWMENRKPH